MNRSNTSNPVLLTEQATQKLPRLLLFCMLLAYALCGLIGKDPWRGDDATSFGLAVAFSKHWGVDALQSVAGVQLAHYSPVWFALIGLFIRALWFLPAPIAAIIPVSLTLLSAVYALWHATYYMAQTPAAQPLTLAFGGQPHPLAYATAVADGAVLLLLATLGIVLPLHEMTAQTFQFALLCTLLTSVALSLYIEKQRLALVIMFGTMFILAASIGLQAAITSLVWLLVLSRFKAWAIVRRTLPYLVLFTAIGFSVPFIWAYLLGQMDYGDALWSWNQQQVGWISYSRLKWLVSNGLFITWPIAPFALAALWRWRKQWQSPHIALGLSFMSVFAISLLTLNDLNDSDLMMMIPGALILAAFLLPALPRVWMNAIDWFGVMALSFVAFLCWLVWLAMSFGIPEDLSHSIMRLAPNLNTHIRWFAVTVAIFATLFWVFVVRWRILAAKTVVWRAAVIWSAGSLTVWVLIGTLFMPWLNHVKTYKPMAFALKAALAEQQATINLELSAQAALSPKRRKSRQILKQLSPSACISPLHIALPQRAVLAYFGEITFEPHHLLSETESSPDAQFMNNPDSVACDWILEYDASQSLANVGRLPYLADNADAPEGKWVLRWEGRRFIEKDEHFRLYQREYSR
jgi:hypothetical protein